MAYFQSKAAGYIGVAVMVIGVVLQIAPALMPFVPQADKADIAQIITLLGGLKAWLAANPFQAKAAS